MKIPSLRHAAPECGHRCRYGLVELRINLTSSIEGGGATGGDPQGNPFNASDVNITAVFTVTATPEAGRWGQNDHTPPLASQKTARTWTVAGFYTQDYTRTDVGGTEVGTPYFLVRSVLGTCPPAPFHRYREQ